jgi:hypothetical protein
MHFEPLTEAENIQTTQRIMWAITKAPQSMRGSYLLAFDAVSATDAEADIKPGHVGLRELEEVNPYSVDFRQRLDDIHASFGITESDGKPLIVPHHLAALNIKQAAKSALLLTHMLMHDFGALPKPGEGGRYANPRMMYEILQNDPDLRTQVLAVFADEREEIMAKVRESHDAAKALHSLRVAQRTATTSPDTRTNKHPETITPKGRLQRAIGSLAARLGIK